MGPRLCAARAARGRGEDSGLIPRHLGDNEKPRREAGFLFVTALLCTRDRDRRGRPRFRAARAARGRGEDSGLIPRHLGDNEKPRRKAGFLFRRSRRVRRSGLRARAAKKRTLCACCTTTRLSPNLFLHIFSNSERADQGAIDRSPVQFEREAARAGSSVCWRTTTRTVSREAQWRRIRRAPRSARILSQRNTTYITCTILTNATYAGVADSVRRPRDGVRRRWFQRRVTSREFQTSATNDRRVARFRGPRDKRTTEPRSSA